MQVLTWGSESHVWGNGRSYRGRVGDGSLSSPVVTSYRFPIVARGLSVTVLPPFGRGGRWYRYCQLLSKATVCSSRLSIQTTIVSGTGWPQFATQFLTGGRVVSPQFTEGLIVGDGFLSSSPVGLPICSP